MADREIQDEIQIFSVAVFDRIVRHLVHFQANGRWVPTVISKDGHYIYLKIRFCFQIFNLL